MADSESVIEESGGTPVAPGLQTEEEDSKQGKDKKKRERPRGKKDGKPKEKEKRAPSPAPAETATSLTTKMRKTKMCDFHAEGKCKYGDKCAFAHDESELQDAPDLRKTRLCRDFINGKCKDNDCKFAHGQDELKASGVCYKTVLCSWHEKGNCSSGDQCRFAHGASELREDPDARKRGAGDDGGRGAKRARTGAPNPECHRCGSTIAKSLGIEVCVLCRY
eukprot:TRINITY_DN23865_c0_g1_i1.p1 TRINITY_DN23865_c0_g1~~TRINITY_DN23865_c0_g1_i1.p1  ORF type:complete len:221 (+),score=43.74 TRINITY_DN23865_c0_g1_i1:98-760(+)